MKIRYLMEKHNIKQRDICEALGVGQSTMSQYVTGKREPDIITLVKIADYFGVSVDYLIGHETAADSYTPPAPGNIVYINGKKVALKSNVLKIDFNDVSVEIKVREDK